MQKTDRKWMKNAYIGGKCVKKVQKTIKNAYIGGKSGQKGAKNEEKRIYRRKK